MKKPKSMKSRSTKRSKRKIRRAGGGVASPGPETRRYARCQVPGCTHVATHATPSRATSPFDPAVLRSITDLHRRLPAIDGNDLFVRVGTEAWRRSRGLAELAEGESWRMTLDDLITKSVFTDSLLSYLARVAVAGDPRGVLTRDTAAWALGRLGVDPVEVDSWGAGDERVRDLADRVWLSVPAIKRALETAWAAPR